MPAIFVNLKKSRLQCVLIFLLLSLHHGVSVGYAQSSYLIQTINAPSALPNSTIVTGISGQSLVGTYNDTNGISRGFLFNESKWVSFPNLTPSGIYSSKIIGQLSSLDVSSPGVVYEKGVTTVFNPILPGGIHTGPTELYGISGSYIVGTYSDKNKQEQGFIYNGSSAWKINNPLTTYNMGGIAVSFGNTVPTSIDAIKGIHVVGYFFSTLTANSARHGFLYDGTNWTTLDCPFGSDTIPSGISGSEIVGTYKDPTGITRGFIRDGTNWSTLDDLLDDVSIATYPTGIDQGTIVGTYADTNTLVHSFQLAPTPVLGGPPPPRPQQITVDTNTLPAIVAFGVAPLPVSATASSGLLVHFSSSNPKVATISGTNIITINGVGVTTITMTQIGDGTYAPATPIKLKLTVTKGTQTISYTTPPPSILKFSNNYQFDLFATSTSGLPVTFKSNKVRVLVITGNAKIGYKATVKGTGTVIITALQAGNPNWSAAVSLTNTIKIQ